MNTKALERAIAYAIDEAHEIMTEIEDEEDKEWFYSAIVDRLQTALDNLPF